jgi:hypothetical protein
MNRKLNVKGYEYNEAVKANPAIVKKEMKLSLVKMGTSIFLVNGSDEILDSIRAEEWGFCGEISLQNTNDFFYEDVLPNEAVLVYEQPSPKDDNYIFLSDFTLGTNIYIESKSLGNIRISPKTIAKTGIVAQPLIFEDSSSPRSVRVIDLDD